VIVKTRFRRKISFIAVGLGLVMFCFGCSMAPPRPKEPAPAPQAEVSPVQQETPATMPKPTPPPPPKNRPVPPNPARTVQEPSPPPPPVKEAHPQPVVFLHTVKYSGETLSIIALWYTGNHGNWKEIAQANPDMKPNRIFPGDEIIIPESLLKNRDPLPKEFVDRICSKAQRGKGKLKAQNQTVQPQQEEPKLFGPKKSTPQ
jgi:nucleoid-associated protein YgaU